MPTRQWFASVAAALLAIAIASALLSASRTPAIDFWHFRAVAIARRHGAPADVYGRAGREAIHRLTVAPFADDDPSREARAAQLSAAIDRAFLGYDGVDTVATPALLAFAALFSHASYAVDHALWAALSVVALFAALIALARLLAGVDLAAAALLAAIVGLTSAPLASDLRVGNVNALELALVAGMLALTRRERFANAGLLAGAAALFKPTLAPSVLLVVIALRARARVRFAAAVIAGAALTLVASSVAFGAWEAWPAWARVLDQILGGDRSLADGNYALLALVDRRAAPVVAPLLLGTLAVATARSRAPTDERVAQSTAAGLAATLLGARLAWLHYFLLALPLLLLALRQRATAWLAAAALLLTSHLATTAGPLPAALATNTAVILLLAASYAPFRILRR